MPLALVAVDDQRVVELPSLALPVRVVFWEEEAEAGWLRARSARTMAVCGGGRGGGAGAVGRGHRHANGLADVGGGEKVLLFVVCPRRRAARPAESQRCHW